MACIIQTYKHSQYKKKMRRKKNYLPVIGTKFADLASPAKKMKMSTQYE
jgi:hypothetical protein